MTFVDSKPLTRFAIDANASMHFHFLGEQALHCTYLAGNAAPEVWQTSADYTWLELCVAESGDLVADSKAVYAELMRKVRASKHPYLIRIWNYLADINAGDEDAERYRQFCVGRAQAVDALFNSPPPAATGIGYCGVNTGLHVIALCSNKPAIALENPRQTPAWQYPRQYGKVSPGFSRGALLKTDGENTLLLASGTASIVGHASMHVGDVAEQCCESLRNLRALLDEGEKLGNVQFDFSACQSLRVYVRDPSQLPIIQAEFESSGIPVPQIVYVHGEVCRRELMVELEGVFGAAS
ncbi:MAG: pteridine-dependent deoxygenase [Arenimonas sp.]|nr:pteridine-dependent deoxygenase [Arenimonas sp.]